MATRREIELQIRADSKDAQAGVDAARESVDELGRAAKEAGQQAEGAAGQVGQVGQQAPQIDKAAGATTRWQKATELLKGQWDALGSRLQKLSIGGLIAGGVAIGVAAIGRLGPAFLQANDDIDVLRTGLQTLGRDQEQINDRIRELRSVASDAGQGLKFLGDLYLDFTGKADAAKIPLQTQNRLFDELVRAGGELGLSNGRIASSVDILNRMLTSQTVSMTQLERLSRRIPGAMDGVAKALGLTTSELRDLADAGQLAAQDVIPALAQSLQGVGGTAEGTSAIWQRLKNAVTEALQAMGDTGGVTVLNAGIKVLAEGLRLVVVPLTALVTGLTSFGQTAVGVATTIAALVDTSTSWSEKTQIMGQIWDDVGEKLAGNIDRLKDVDAAFARAAGMADKSADATGRVADANAKAGASAAKLASDYLKVNAALQQSIELAEREVTAAKARGDAAIAQAKALGDEEALRAAISTAARRQADALQTLAERRQTEVEVLQAELANKTALYAQDGALSEARKSELQGLQELIDARRLDADQALAQAAAATANAKARSEEALAAEAHTDALRASNIVRRAEDQTKISLLQTEKELARQAEETARRMGNEYAARQARIKQLEIDIQITEAKADAMRAEAQGSIDVATATLEELRLKGELTKVKEAELNASIRVAEAKIRESEAIRASIELQKDAIRNVRLYGDEVDRAGERSHRATGRMRDGWDGVALSTRDAAAAAEEYAAAQARLDAKYGSPSEGPSRIGEGGDGHWGSRRDSTQAIKNWIRNNIGEEFIDDARAIQAAVALINSQTFGVGSGTMLSAGGLGKLSAATAQAYELIREMEHERASQKQAEQEPARAASRVTGAGADGAGGLASVVRVELPGGRRFDVDSTNAAGRDQLNGLIRALGDAKLRAA